MALQQAAERIVALRGLDAASGSVLAAMEGRAGRALRHRRTAGTVRNPAKSRTSALWALAAVPARPGFVPGDRHFPSAP